MNTETRIEVFDKLAVQFIDKDFRDWLVENGFFTAPASAKYHGNYEGGLFDHSFAVANILMDLSAKNDLKWQRAASPFIVGMLHDLCKIDQYKKVKPGLEYKESPYEYNKDTLLKGHGDKSVMMIASHLQLTEEEVMCIRYHMGAFVEKEERNDYTRAVYRYPNVLWTHHADMIVSHVVGI